MSDFSLLINCLNHVLEANQSFLLIDSKLKVLDCTAGFYQHIKRDKCEPKGMFFNSLFEEISLTDVARASESNAVFFTRINPVFAHNAVRLKISLFQAGEKGEYYYALVEGNHLADVINKDIFNKIRSIEKLSKSRPAKYSSLNAAIINIIDEAAEGMKIERINVWLTDEKFSTIRCIASRENQDNHNAVLNAVFTNEQIPGYFKHLQQEELIAVSDTLTDDRVAELKESYLIPLKIKSMMDVPIRDENGRVIGIVCFENTNELKSWSLIEQKFGYYISQCISLAIETFEKKKADEELKRLLAENSLLLNELHHRVKNNFTILIALIKLQSEKTKDEFHRQLFEECLTRIYSIANIHKLLYSAPGSSRINLDQHLRTIIENIDVGYAGKEKPEIVIDFENVSTDISKALTTGLLVNELVTNAFKHGIPNDKKPIIKVGLRQTESSDFEVTVSDNGPGFQEKKNSDDSMGMTIINGLSQQIGADVKFENKEGCHAKVTVSRYYDSV
jgi:two-component sensor histidine kinase